VVESKDLYPEIEATANFFSVKRKSAMIGSIDTPLREPGTENAPAAVVDI
jgi:hypothetical protein